MGRDAREALARSRRALAEFQVDGVKTNLPFHRGIIDNAAFLDAEVSTNLLDRVGPAAFVPAAAEMEMPGEPMTEPMTTAPAMRRRRTGCTLPLEAADIMRIIPHRYPFLLVDRVVELEPGKRGGRASRASPPTSRSSPATSPGARSCPAC